MTGSLTIALLTLFASHAAWGARTARYRQSRSGAHFHSEQNESSNDFHSEQNESSNNTDRSAPPLHWAKYAARGQDLEEFVRNVDMNADLHQEYALLEETDEGGANTTSEEGLGGYSERKTFCPAHWRDRVDRKGKWVGGGSFGKVYVAKVTCDPKNQVTMAFKVQKSTAYVDAEIKMQESFDHPNIVRAVDHYKGPKRGQVTMLMEAAGGGDFEKLLGARTPNYALIEQLMYESLLATKHVNDMGIVHSDIKPENIMLSSKCGTGHCHAKLADFGVSCSLKIRNDCSGWAGTPLYMSPEMCHTGKRHKSDDAWALGVTLHMLIYNNYPKPIREAMRARTTEDMLRGIGRLMIQKWKYHAAHTSRLENLMAGLLVADPRNRMGLDEAAALLTQPAATAPDSGAPPCWSMCERTKCYRKKPLQPCLVTEDGRDVACGADEAEDVEDEADARLLEIVINRGYRAKCGFNVDEVQAKVKKVTPGSPAATADLRVGDQIVSIQHKKWKKLRRSRRKEIISTYSRIVLEVYRS